MTRSTGKRKFHFKHTIPTHPAVSPFGDWLSTNRTFYADFRRWLKDGGYSDSALKIYGVAARLAIGLLNKPYWLIDPQADLDQVRDHITANFPSVRTLAAYHQGLAKLAEYVRLRCRKSNPEPLINWDYYLGSLPDWLAEDVLAYLAHCRRAWLPEQHYRYTLNKLGRLTLPLRWMATHTTLIAIEDLTPALWFEYADTRLAAGIKPATINNELTMLQRFLYFLADQDRPICRRLLHVESLAEGPHLPRDVPAEQLCRLLQEIRADVSSPHAGIRRMGLMDQAWFLLMLHSGLRTQEVRRLRMSDLDLDGHRVRIEQSKGLKDRIVCLSQVTVDALQAYLEVRGPSGTADNHVFLYRHMPLSSTYCGNRLRTYGKRCGVYITAHQLRHSCATLLLNAGAPILTVQAILGHKHIDTTLVYARLYDGTVAADYYQAMVHVERRLASQENTATPPPSSGELLALVDSLRNGTLNEAQAKTVRVLRAGILALAELSNQC